MTEFKIGDVVRLKSGGPSMTVTNDHGDGHVYVCWWEKSLEGSAFPSVCLMVAEKSEQIHDRIFTVSPPDVMRPLDAQEFRPGERHEWARATPEVHRG